MNFRTCVTGSRIFWTGSQSPDVPSEDAMETGKISYYEQAYTLRGENARLRKRIELLEQGLGIPALKASHEKELHKKDHAIEMLRKESRRYHDLWQRQVSRNGHETVGEEGEELLSLRAENSTLKKDNELLKSQLKDALEQIKKLKAQINRDFENSSLPSSDRPFHKKIHNSRVQSGRRPGGQAGHTGHRRPHMQPTEPPVEIPVPEDIAEDPDYYLTGKTISKQVVDLRVSVTVTEYRTPEYRSRTTGIRGHAPFPSGIANEFGYGPNARALAFLLNSYCNVSIDKTREIIAGLSDGSILLSKGMISHLPEHFSDATEAERKKIFEHLTLSPSIHADFTPGRVNGKCIQILLCTDGNELLYLMRDHKGHKGIAGSPLEHYRNVIIHDHDSTFYSYGGDHQECLAHVLRYLQDSIDNEPCLHWNRDMKAFLSKMIHDTKDRRPDLSPEEILSIEREYDRILVNAELEYREHPPSKYYPDGYNLFSRMKKYKREHLLFLKHPEIEYTNNPAERGLRKYKRKQKQAVTFRSKNSVETLCNCMSIIETMRSSDVNIYLVAAKAFSAD